MSNLGYPLLIVGFMFSLITYTYQNLEYKTIERLFVQENVMKTTSSTLSEQMAKQASCGGNNKRIMGIQCHGNEGKLNLLVKNAEYISQNR